MLIDPVVLQRELSLPLDYIIGLVQNLSNLEGSDAVKLQRVALLKTYIDKEYFHCACEKPRTIRQDITEGHVLPKAVLLYNFASIASPLNEHRHEYQKMYYRALAQVNSTFAPEKQRSMADIVKVVEELERSVYNQAIRNCQSQGTSVMRSWKNPTFISYYSTRASTIYLNINPTSSIVQTHGNRVGIGLLEETMTPLAVGSSTESELCPSGSKSESTIVEIRRKQKVEEKTSSWWTCPNPGCRAQSCTYREVQDRSADEPASIYCTCTKCGTNFKGA